MGLAQDFADQLGFEPRTPRLFTAPFGRPRALGETDKAAVVAPNGPSKCPRPNALNPWLDDLTQHRDLGMSGLMTPVLQNGMGKRTSVPESSHMRSSTEDRTGT